MKNEFMYVFQLDKLTLFNVNFYTLSTNSMPRFSTSADHFMRNKRDFNRCGQAQADLLPSFQTAYSFWQKWDKYHLKNLTQAEYDELLADLESLKAKYNYLSKDLSKLTKPYSPKFQFRDLVILSIQIPKYKYQKLNFNI